MCSWDKLWTIKNPTAASKCQKQKQGNGHEPHIQHPGRGGQTTVSHSPLLTHQSTPTLTLFKVPACLPHRVSMSTCFLFCLFCWSASPNKVPLEFVVCPSTNFYWLRNRRTQVWKIFTLNGFHFANKLTPTFHFSLQITFLLCFFFFFSTYV